MGTQVRERVLRAYDEITHYSFLMGSDGRELTKLDDAPRLRIEVFARKSSMPGGESQALKRAM